MLASQSTNSGFTSDHVDSIWQLTSIDNPGRTGRKQYTTVAQLPQPGHRRGWTEGTKRMSIFKTRSRSNTTVNLAMGYQLSPASSAKPSESLYQIPENRPQSGWSDSDRSDSFTKGKSWVLKGSRILKKQNSKFNLSSARTMDWVTKYDESADVSNGYLPREHKHTRVWSDVDSECRAVIDQLSTGLITYQVHRHDRSFQSPTISNTSLIPKLINFKNWKEQATMT